MLKISSESSMRSGFHKICTINHYLLGAVITKMAKLKTLKFVKKYFFSIKLLQAHLHDICNTSAKCWKDPAKALRGADFTKYALSTIIYLMQSSKNGSVKSPVSLAKKKFSIKLLHAHLPNVCNIHVPAQCWKYPVKALWGVDFTKYALSTIIY